MAAADIHHRTPEFRALYQRVLKQLQAFVGTKNDVILLAASGGNPFPAGAKLPPGGVLPADKSKSYIAFALPAH